MAPRNRTRPWKSRNSNKNEIKTPVECWIHLARNVRVFWLMNPFAFRFSGSINKIHVFTRTRTKLYIHEWINANIAGRPKMIKMMGVHELTKNKSVEGKINQKLNCCCCCCCGKERKKKHFFFFFLLRLLGAKLSHSAEAVLYKRLQRFAHGGVSKLKWNIFESKFKLDHIIFFLFVKKDQSTY